LTSESIGRTDATATCSEIDRFRKWARELLRMHWTQNASDTKTAKSALGRNSAQPASANSSHTSGKSERASSSQKTASIPAKTRFSSATSNLSLIHFRKRILSMRNITFFTEILTTAIQKIAQAVAEEFQRRTAAVGEADSLSKLTNLQQIL